MRATTSRGSGKSSAIGFTVGMRSVNVSMPTIFITTPPHAMNEQRRRLYHAVATHSNVQVAEKGPDARRRERQRSRWALFSDLRLVHDEAAVDAQCLPRHVAGARPRE